MMLAADWKFKAVIVMGIVYWSTVALNGVRLYFKTGHMPEVQPNSAKERMLWLGWLTVICGWFAQPLWLDEYPGALDHIAVPFFFQDWIAVLGILLVVSGYGATLWSYYTLDLAWSLSAERDNNSLVQKGPYRWIRHPVYFFQGMIFLGVCTILPTALSGLLFIVLAFCIFHKAHDEEKILTRLFKDQYQTYMRTTGRFWPKIKKRQL